MTTALSDTHAAIWVVEDDFYTLKICLRLLEKNGFSCRGFETAEELLAENWRSGVAVVLSDIHLPGISGKELCRQLKLEKHPHLRVIALDTSKEERILLQAGFDSVIEKPFTEEMLLEALSGGKTTVLSFPLLEQLVEDPDDRNDIIGRMRFDTVNDLHALEAAIREKDAKNVEFYVHRMAGRLGQMNQSDLDSQLRRIETLLGDGAGIADVLPELEKAQEEVKVFLGKLGVLL